MTRRGSANVRIGGEEGGAGGTPAADEVHTFDFERRRRADTEQGGTGGASAADEKPPLRSLWVPPGPRPPRPTLGAPQAAASPLGLQLLRLLSLAAPPPAATLRRRSTLLATDVAHNLTDDVVRKLRSKFARYDRDESGFVSTAELGVLMRDLGFTLSRRRLAALASELDGGGDEAGIKFTALVRWYDGLVQKAINRKLERQSGWRKHAAALGRATTLPPRVRIVIAWLLVWAVFVALALLAVVYGRVFGPQQTQLVITSLGIAQAQTISLQEPLLIVVLALLPALIDRIAPADSFGAEFIGSWAEVFLTPIRILFN